MVPPVPIPNTVVKHVKAESTWLETAREDRKLPVKNTRYTLCVSRIFIWIKASYPTGASGMAREQERKERSDAHRRASRLCRRERNIKL